MARPNELLASGLQPSLSGESDLFSEAFEFCRFIWEELKPFPGRGQAVVRLVVSAVIAVLISETLRIPNPAYSAYLVFFVANEDGVSSVKMGLLAMAGLTVALLAATVVSICFMDAPWFRLPATFLLIAGAIWLSRTLVLAVMGRLMAVILALYLSLADTIFDPESLTESTLWLWSIVGVTVGVSVVVSFLLEPRPDLLLRAQIATCLGSVQHALESVASGRPGQQAEARTLRRQIYAAPLRMQQLLARWRQRNWPAQQDDVDWELGIFIVERLLAISAALAASRMSMADKETTAVVVRMAKTVDVLKCAVEKRNRDAIRSLAIPSLEELPDSMVKTGLVELAAALAECRFVLVPSAVPKEVIPAAMASPPKPWTLVPDALTNPEYSRFAIKTILAIFACEVFMNAVEWPGIRTSMITCAVTALATGGAQSQKQLLRLTGACVGGLMGLVSIVYLVPRMDTIVSLSLLVAVGTACCAWVAAGSVRSSYAGFQMVLAFYIMLLPGFDTSIDLTGIRDRFVGILVGITAMWIFFDHLWHTSSRRLLVEKFIALLRLMAKAPNLVSSTMSLSEGRRQLTSFRRDLYATMNAARQLVDEAKMELMLTLDPRTVRGTQLEVMGTEVSFAAFLLVALNEKRLRVLPAGNLESVERLLQPVDAALAQCLDGLADAVQQFEQEILLSKDAEEVQLDLPRPNLSLAQLPETNAIGYELRSVYESLFESLKRISASNGVIRSLP